MPKLNDYTEAPDDLALLEFFESEPLDSEGQVGYWCYQYTDQAGVGIRLSCSTLEKSVQTTLLLNGEEVQTVLHEGAEELAIDGDVLRGRFSLEGDSKLEVQLRPRIAVRWSSLRAV